MSQTIKDMKSPSAVAVMRLAFGCACNQCIDGFISPRTVFALLCQAEIHYDLLNDMLEYLSGPEWCDSREDLLEHLDPSVRHNLCTNKFLRQGFVNLFRHIATALQAKRLPSTNVVLQYAEGEWPPNVKRFLQRGGTVYAVMQAYFDCAIGEDLYLGIGEHEATFKKDIDALPVCRNDREFVSARRQYRRLEGLPDEVNPKPGLGGIW